MPTTSQLNHSLPVIGELDDSIYLDAAQMTGSMSDVDRAKLRRTVDTHGCFGLHLSDAQANCLRTTTKASSQFFALHPDDPVKQSIVDIDDDYGWGPPKSEPAYQPSTVALVETFEIGLEHARGDGAFWPDVPGFRQALQSCWETLAVLGDQALRAICDSYSIDPGQVVEECRSRELNSLRMLHYPTLGSDRNPTDTGISAHTDFECITLLYQTEPGLEILDPSSGWQRAPAHQDRLLVIFGDMLECWTNGRIQATGHRVHETSCERFSIAMFIAADDNVVVAPLPQFVSGHTPSRYAPMKQRAHIDNEIARARANSDTF